MGSSGDLPLGPFALELGPFALELGPFALERWGIGKFESRALTGDAEPSPGRIGRIETHQAVDRVDASPRPDGHRSRPGVAWPVSHFRGDPLQQHAPMGLIGLLPRVGLEGHDGTNGGGVELRPGDGAKQY